jgi:hypothetical protein
MAPTLSASRASYSDFSGDLVKAPFGALPTIVGSALD